MRSPDSTSRSQPAPLDSARRAAFDRLVRALTEEHASLDHLLAAMRENRTAYVQLRPSSLESAAERLAVDAHRVRLLGEHRESARSAFAESLGLSAETSFAELATRVPAAQAEAFEQLCSGLRATARSLRIEQRLAERLLDRARDSSEALCLQFYGLVAGDGVAGERGSGPAIYDRHAATHGSAPVDPRGRLLRGTF